MDSIEQKAKSLVEEMYAHQWREGAEEYRAAKQCALICVDEIIELLDDLRSHSEKYIFLEKVKEKIQSL